LLARPGSFFAGEFTKGSIIRLGTSLPPDDWPTKFNARTRPPVTTYDESNPRLLPTAHIARHPIHPMLVPIPIVCFIGALVTDIVYAASA
jgi:hypothetical protein